MRRSLRVWARRFGWLMGVVVFLLAVRLVWGWESGRRLEGVKAELRAKGIRFGEQAEEAGNEENMQMIFTRALEAAPPFDRGDSDLIEGNGSVTLSERIWTGDEKAKMKEVFERYKESFRLIDIAKAKRPPVESGSHVISNLGLSRSLADVLLASAIVAHENGQEMDALIQLDRCLTIAFIMDHRGNLISHLIAVAIRGSLSATIERIEPTLKLSDANGTMSRARELVQALADPKLHSFARTNFEGEIGSIEFFAKEYYGLNDWWIRPLRDDDVARAMASSAHMLEATRAQDWRTGDKLFRSSMPAALPETNLNRLVYWNSGEQGIGPNYLLLHFRRETDRLAAAILLASHIYAAERGHLPGSLSDMVPGIFAEVPVDPFSSPHAAMRYRLDPGGPTVWSVGENGTDEDGVAPFLSPGIGGRSPMKRGDYNSDIIYGAGWRESAKPAATTKAVSGP